MGRRGPVPKHSSERRRRNKDSEPASTPPQGEAIAAVKVPPAKSHWHGLAKSWYRSLKESGQARYFEPSDWQAAQLVAEELSRYMKSKKRSAIMFSYLWSAMTDLLTTEGARRRLKIEIDRGDADEDKQPAGVTALDDYRDELAS